jgi:xylulokinase
MGGGSRSRLWIQLLADILARPVETTDLAETTALGAGILAASAIELDGEKDVVATAERMTGRWLAVEPLGSATEHYERLAATYERIYPALAPVFADLAELDAIADSAHPMGRPRVAEHAPRLGRSTHGRGLGA